MTYRAPGAVTKEDENRDEKEEDRDQDEGRNVRTCQISGLSNEIGGSK
jgi:hypothetical protein